MRAFEAKQAADKKASELFYDDFLKDINEAAKKNGSYSLGYYLDDLDNIGIKKGAVNLITAKLEEEGFYTEIVPGFCDDLEELVIEWDLAEKPNSKALEVKEAADTTIAKQNIDWIKNDIKALINNKPAYKITYYIDDLYDRGIKEGSLKKIAVMLCEDGYDTLLDMPLNEFSISWDFVEDDNSMGMPTFIYE